LIAESEEIVKQITNINKNCGEQSMKNNIFCYIENWQVKPRQKHQMTKH